MKVGVLPLVALAGLSGLVGYIAGVGPASDVIYDPGGVPQSAFGKVLDGDTVVVDGTVTKIRGLDAPEIGTSASCLAEAALGGLAKQHLSGQLFNYVDTVWTIENVEMVEGRQTADFMTSDGISVAESMTMNGYAILSEDRWDWCQVSPNFDARTLYPSINAGSGPPSDVALADD